MRPVLRYPMGIQGEILSLSQFLERERGQLEEAFSDFWILSKKVEPKRDEALVWPHLSEEEKARALEMTHPRAKGEFCAGRLLIRFALSHLLGISPGELALQRSERGAVSLQPKHASSWRFNLSHSHGLAVLGLALGEVGVDLEQVERPARIEALSKRYFSEREWQDCLNLPEESLRRRRFFDLWTLKESYIKARQEGMAISLRSFGFSFDEQGISFWDDVDEAREGAQSRGRWHFGLWDLPASQHRLALSILKG